MLTLGEEGRNSATENLKEAETTPDVLTPGTQQALDKHALNKGLKTSQQEWQKKQGPTFVKGVGHHIPGQDG